MVAALDLAKYIVHKANGMNESITHLKLQKILYYVAGVFAGALNKRAFSDRIEAWQYGPVVRNVYIEFCSWGALPLTYKEDIKLDYGEKEMELVDFIINQKILYHRNINFTRRKVFVLPHILPFSAKRKTEEKIFRFVLY